MLAERMNTFSGSPTSALIAKVAELRAEGKDIISLNVGEPDFGTPDYIKCGAIKAIVDNFKPVFTKEEYLEQWGKIGEIYK